MLIGRHYKDTEVGVLDLQRDFYHVGLVAHQDTLAVQVLIPTKAQQKVVGGT